MGNLIILPLAASLLAARLPAFRAWSPTRRLQAVAILTVLGLACFWLSIPSVNDATLTGRPSHTYSLLLLAAGGLLAGFAAGLLWSAIRDDAGSPRTKLGIDALLWIPFLLGAWLGGWTPVLIVPLAIRTGWTRQVAESRRPLATLAGAVAFLALLLWPYMTVSPAAPAGGPVTGAVTGAAAGAAASAVADTAPEAASRVLPGLTLYPLLRTFLLVQVGLQTMRFTLGLIFGPRRIGRRLLVSHMLAGLIPVALLMLFAILISLLMMANHRVRTASKMLQMQHRFSQELLDQRIRDELVSMRLDPRGTTRFIRPDQLPELAVRLASRWPELAAWRHDTATEWRDENQDRSSPNARVSDGREGETLPLADGVLVTLALQTETEEEPYALTIGRSIRPVRLPSPVEWYARTVVTGGAGLVRIMGSTFHVADFVLTADQGRLRVQLIEELPAGRVRVLEECLYGQSRIEEAFTFTGDNRFTAAEALLDTATGDGGETPESPSPINTSHVLLPALQWSPPGAAHGADSAAENEADGMIRTGAIGRDSHLPGGPGWHSIRIPVLGTARLGDLIPRLTSPSNPVGYVPIIILVFAALLFVGVESFAFFSAVRMGRSIAHSVSRLREGTERLQAGDFAFRIESSGRDELASLAGAFNEMAAGLEVAQRTALEKERLEGELSLARRIQQRLLPTTPPQVQGLEFAGHSLPARQVGGDYYDYVCLDDHRILFVMADVSGKGTPAALLMSSVRASLRSMLPTCEDCGQLVRNLNRFIHESTSLTEFVTLFLGVIDARTGELEYVNAGHEHPFVLKANGELTQLTEGGLVLGAFAEAPYDSHAALLQPGDSLLLYTDGLTDATNAQDEMFGIDRLRTCLHAKRGCAPREVLENLLEATQQFVQSGEAIDDITLLALRREGVGAGSSGMDQATFDS